MRRLELVYTPTGSVELLGANERVIWASDDDDDFAEKNTNEILDDADSAQILDYLIDERIITEEEADEVEIFKESDSTDSDDELEGNIIDADFKDV
ncbi:MAG: hypothetical protein WBR29_03035 [Gammaproteobacteria bacterium]